MKRIITILSYLFVLNITAESALNFSVKMAEGPYSLDRIKQYLELGVNPDEYDADGNTPLINALYAPTKITNWTYAEFLAERKLIVTLLIDFKAKTDLMSKGKNKFPLLEASSSGATEIVELLLEKGANVNLATQKEYSDWRPAGTTPLHGAVQSASISRYEPSVTAILSILCQYKANVNAKDKDKNTPLHISAIVGKATVTQLLLENGANKKIKNKEGKTAFDIAIGKGYLGVAQLLKE